MRPLHALSGGVSKFAKACSDKTFPAVVKEAYDDALAGVSLAGRLKVTSLSCR